MTASHAYFITGTDTEIGKTFVTCALLHAGRKQGLRVVGMKPVAAGTELTDEGMVNEDVARLQAASGAWAPLALVNPYGLRCPVSPHIAAREEGVEISLEVIGSAYRRLTELADMVLVEGVGGFRVPLGPELDSTELARSLGLPVILVVGMRLGCINHALLTAEAVAARGLSLAGWVANRVDPEMLRFDENLATLTQYLPAPLLGVLPRFASGHAQDGADGLRLP